jgi:hypothetical protein
MKSLFVSLNRYVTGQKLGEVGFATETSVDAHLSLCPPRPPLQLH